MKTGMENIVFLIVKNVISICGVGGVFWVCSFGFFFFFSFFPIQNSEILRLTVSSF